MLKTYTISSLYEKPYIRITGKWLEKNNFNIGDKFELYGDNEILVLIKMSEKDKNDIEKLNQIKKLKKQITMLQN